MRRRFWLALAAILTVLAAKATGFDQSLLENLFDSGAEAIVNEQPDE